jgi:hypothetical protein
MTLECKYRLYAVEELWGHECFVLAWVVHALPAHNPDVERIGERDGEPRARELTATGMKSSFGEVGLQRSRGHEPVA